MEPWMSDFIGKHEVVLPHHVKQLAKPGILEQALMEKVADECKGNGVLKVELEATLQMMCGEEVAIPLRRVNEVLEHVAECDACYDAYFQALFVKFGDFEIPFLPEWINPIKDSLREEDKRTFEDLLYFIVHMPIS